MELYIKRMLRRKLPILGVVALLLLIGLTMNLLSA